MNEDAIYLISVVIKSLALGKSPTTVSVKLSEQGIIFVGPFFASHSHELIPEKLISKVQEVREAC